MKLKKMFTKVAALALTGAALLATSCSGLLDKDGETKAAGTKATVRFAEATARTIKSSFAQESYTYTLTAVSGGTTYYLGAEGTAGTTAETALDPVSYSVLTGATDGWEFEAGNYTFTLDAYKDSVRVLTASDEKTLAAGGTSSLSFALAGLSGDSLTGAVTVTVNYSAAAEKDNVAYVKALLGESVTDVSAASADNVTLDTSAYTVSYTNAAVPAATNLVLTILFYDNAWNEIGYQQEPVYVYASDSVTVSRTYTTLKNLYPYTIFSQDFDSVTISDENPVTNYATNVTTGNGGWTSAIETSGYLKGSQGGTGARSWNTTMDLYAPASGDYVLEFDAQLTTGLPNSGDTDAAQFSVATATATNAKTTAYLLSMTSTEKYTSTATGYTWTIENGESTPTITLLKNTFYHFTLAVGDTVTLTITNADGSATDITGVALTVAGSSKTAKAFQFYDIRGSFASVWLDNIVVKSASDVLAFTTAASIAGESAAESTGSVSLTASSAARWLGTDTEVTPTYSWSITSGADYATLSASGSAATLTGANSTINNQNVIVSVTATAADGVTSTATKTVTVAADQSLLSDVTVSESAQTVVLGTPLTLTVSGGEKASSVTGSDVVWSWTTSDESVATVAAGDTDGTATVTGVTGAEPGSTVTITATATLGSIVKSQSFTVTVLGVLGEGTAAITTSGSDYGTITASASVNGTLPDDVTPSYSWSIPAAVSGVSINSATGVLTSTNHTDTAVTVCVTVTAENYDTITQTGSITVPAAAYFDSVTVTPVTATLKKDAVKTMTATADANVALTCSWAVYTDEACTTLADSSLATIVASENNTASATLTLSNETGDFVTLYVKVTATADDSPLGLTAKSDTTSLTVSTASYETTVVSGVTVSAAATSLAYNGSTTLTAAVDHNTATITSYAWSVSGNATLAATEDGTYATTATTTTPTVYFKAANDGDAATASVSVTVTYVGYTASEDGLTKTDWDPQTITAEEPAVISLGAAPGSAAGITITSVVSDSDLSVSAGSGDDSRVLTASGITGATAYRWYVDLAEQTAETGASLDLSSATLTSGTHFILVTTTVNGVTYSAEATISVE